MNFIVHKVKGIDRCLLDADLDGEPLHVHVSEIEPGMRSHPPHRHGGFEAFYVLEGTPTLEIDGEEFQLGPNEASVFDPHKLHGLVNKSDAPARYMVIIANTASD